MVETKRTKQNRNVSVGIELKNSKWTEIYKTFQSKWDGIDNRGWQCYRWRRWKRCCGCQRAVTGSVCRGVAAAKEERRGCCQGKNNLSLGRLLLMINADTAKAEEKKKVKLLPKKRRGRRWWCRGVSHSFSSFLFFFSASSFCYFFCYFVSVFCLISFVLFFYSPLLFSLFVLLIIRKKKRWSFDCLLRATMSFLLFFSTCLHSLNH